MKKLRCLEKSSGQALFDVPIDKLIEKDRAYYFPSRFLNKKKFRWSKSSGLLAPFGPVQWLSFTLPGGTTIRNAFWRVRWFHPFYLKFWGRVGIKKFTEGLLLEKLEESEFETIGLRENDLKDQNLRIEYLIEQVLQLIETRDDETTYQSRLYRDAKDGRFWHYVSWEEGGEERKRLLYVNQMQWQYSYLEKKLGLEKNTMAEEQEFYDSLEEDSRGQACEEEGCEARNVRYSSLCREHHFEAIRGKKFTAPT